MTKLIIYTKEDMVLYDDDGGNEIEIEDDKIVEDVLYNVEYTDYIYTTIHDAIEDKLGEVAL